MEDILVSTSKRLAKVNPNGVRSAAHYMIDHSEDMRRDVGEVWDRLQVARLHEDRRVKLANLRAARIVSGLTVLFAASPGFVDAEFSNEHARLKGTPYMTYYSDRAGKSVVVPRKFVEFLPLDRLIGFKYEPGKPLSVPIEHIVQAKDFVAGLTDSRARSLHLELFGN